MRKLFVTLIATFIMMFGVVTPARATVWYNCAQYNACLFQWIDWGGNQWYSSFQNIYQHPNSCLTIPPAKWPNGTNVSDNSGSLVTNGDLQGGNVWQHYTIYFFNWINCNPDGGVYAVPLDGLFAVRDLTILHYYNVPSISLYHTVTSMQLLPST